MLSTEPSSESRCANCGIIITWPPLRRGEKDYCCAGCAMGGPCTCSYDHASGEGPVKVFAPIDGDGEAAQ